VSRARILFVSGALVLGMARPAVAGPLRPFFEPTDLELEEPGVLDIDVQIGGTYGRRAIGNRWVVADVEIDYGLTSSVELGIDAAIGEEDTGAGVRQWRGESLWPSVKLGLLDATPIGAHAFAFGVQGGPRIPTVNGGVGAGYAALALFGWSWRRLHAVLNAGFLIEPGGAISSQRPSGALFGIDLVVDLDDKARFALTSELGGTALASGGPGEAHQTLGLLWSPVRTLSLSLVLLEGLFPNGDRAGVLLGVSPKVAFF
jgi:hypothetical protein